MVDVLPGIGRTSWGAGRVPGSSGSNPAGMCPEPAPGVSPSSPRKDSSRAHHRRNPGAPCAARLCRPGFLRLHPVSLLHRRATARRASRGRERDRRGELLPGNPASEWDVTGAGDPSIQGFATDISVDQGQTVDFKIDTTSTDYRIDIYRLGYYGGLGARKVDTIDTGRHDRDRQPDCLIIDGTTDDNLVDCGNWSVSASWAVPADAASGIYIARPTASRRRRRPPATSSSSSATTTAAPTSCSRPPTRPGRRTTSTAATACTRARRPRPQGQLQPAVHDPRRRRPRTGCSTPSTRCCAGWSATATTSATSPDVDSDRSVARSSSTRPSSRSATTSTGRPGSARTSRRRVTPGWTSRSSAATRSTGRRAGSRARPTAAAPTTARSCPTRKATPRAASTTTASATSPATRIPTPGPGCGARTQPGHDGGRPENALSGQISWGDATDRDRRCRPRPRGLRFWRNTGIDRRDTTLTAGTLGYEFDWEQPAYADQQPRRAGSPLSDTTVAGKNHKMSLYRAPSGALVFGAGTVQWSWGLDGTHDRGGLDRGPADAAGDGQPAVRHGRAARRRLQGGLVAGGAARRRRPRPRSSPIPAGGRDRSRGQRHDLRYGRRHRRRRRGGRGVDRRWDDLGAGDRHDELDLHLQRRPTGRSRSRRAPSTTRPTSATAASVDLRRRRAQDVPVLDLRRRRSTGAEVNDTSAVELGVKFRSDVAGFITGIRFYKTAGNTGTHTGTLWSTAGREPGHGHLHRRVGHRLAGGDLRRADRDRRRHHLRRVVPHDRRATTPIGTSFASAGVDNPPLHALQGGVDGPNGVYRYGGGGVYPDRHLRVVQLPRRRRLRRRRRARRRPRRPIVQRSPGSRARPGVAVTANVTASSTSRWLPRRSDGTTVELRDPSDALVAAAVTYDAGTRTAILDPNDALALQHHLHRDGQGRRRRRRPTRAGQRARPPTSRGPSRRPRRRRRRRTRARAVRSWSSPPPRTRSAATTSRSSATRA